MPAKPWISAWKWVETQGFKSLFGPKALKDGQDRGFKQALKPLLKLYEEGYDPDLELRLQSARISSMKPQTDVLCTQE